MNANEAAVLNHLEHNASRSDVSPTQAEIAKALGLSRSSTQRALKKLKALGKIRMVPGAQRAIELVAPTTIETDPTNRDIAELLRKLLEAQVQTLEELRLIRLGSNNLCEKTVGINGRQSSLVPAKSEHLPLIISPRLLF